MFLASCTKPAQQNIGGCTSMTHLLWSPWEMHGCSTAASLAAVIATFLATVRKIICMYSPYSARLPSVIVWSTRQACRTSLCQRRITKRSAIILCDPGFMNGAARTVNYMKFSSTGTLPKACFNLTVLALFSHNSDYSYLTLRSSAWSTLKILAAIADHVAGMCVI